MVTHGVSLNMDRCVASVKSQQKRRCFDLYVDSHTLTINCCEKAWRLSPECYLKNNNKWIYNSQYSDFNLNCCKWPSRCESQLRVRWWICGEKVESRVLITASQTFWRCKCVLYVGFADKSCFMIVEIQLFDFSVISSSANGSLDLVLLRPFWPDL